MFFRYVWTTVSCKNDFTRQTKLYVMNGVIKIKLASFCVMLVQAMIYQLINHKLKTIAVKVIGFRMQYQI